MIKVAIIGSGFAGIGMAIRLKQSGQSDFVLLERAAEVGGVWRDNVYPGAACDVESQLYSLSFAPNPDWSHTFSRQPEIKAYLQDCITRFGLTEQLRLNHEVQLVQWDSEARAWRLQTSQGEYMAQAVIVAVGALSEPSMPQIPNMDSFNGEIFHSARWKPDIELQGKRVAVIGTGASAIQFIPAIQPEVGQLTVFQRTAAWVGPRGDRPYSARQKWLYQHIPALQKIHRSLIYGFRELTGIGFRRPWVMGLMSQVLKRHLRSQVADPVLREKLRPNYTMGCKRVLLSDDYYPALTQPNVDVITSTIERFTPSGIRDRDGIDYPLDVIIFGTGFQVAEFPFGRSIQGRDGRNLHQHWQGSPQAYLGTTMTGFPNLFFIQGPNTGLGHTSVIYMMESQIEYVVQALQHIWQQQLGAIEPHPEAQAAFVAEVDQRMQQTVWMKGGCESWYIDQTGRNSTLWPLATYSFRQRLQHFEPAAYHHV